MHLFTGGSLIFHFYFYTRNVSKYIPNPNRKANWHSYVFSTKYEQYLQFIRFHFSIFYFESRKPSQMRITTVLLQQVVWLVLITKSNNLAIMFLLPLNHILFWMRCFLGRTRVLHPFHQNQLVKAGPVIWAEIITFEVQLLKILWALGSCIYFVITT